MIDSLISLPVPTSTGARKPGSPARPLPRHAWAVHPQGGCLVIRNLVISELYGMVLHMDNLTDGGARKKRIIRAGGEYLERAGWKRGRWV